MLRGIAIVGEKSFKGGYGISRVIVLKNYGIESVKFDRFMFKASEYFCLKI